MNAHVHPLFASIINSIASPAPSRPARQVFVVEVDIRDRHHHPHDPANESGEMMVSVLASSEEAAIEAAKDYCDDGISGRFRVAEANVVEEHPASADYDIEAEDEET